MKLLTKILMYCMCIYLVIFTYDNFKKSLPVPVVIKTQTQEIFRTKIETIKVEKLRIKNDILSEQIEKDLIKLKAPKEKIPELTRAILVSHRQTGLNSKLIVALMKTESDFDEKAIGPKNRTTIRYKGLLQTPTASSFPDVDTLHGVRILQQKLKETKGDLQKALALYKGGNNPVANKQAKQVINLYVKLQKD